MRLSHTGGPKCTDSDVGASEPQNLQPDLLQQLQEAGRAAEQAADPRKWLQSQPPQQFAVDHAGSASRKESSDVLESISFWSPKLALKTFANGDDSTCNFTSSSCRLDRSLKLGAKAISEEKDSI